MKEVLHSFKDLKTSSSVHSEMSAKKEMETMEQVAGYFNAEVSFYNHNKRFGFARVSIPEGTEINFDIRNKELFGDGKNTNLDDDAVVFDSGHVTESDIVVEAFVHGTNVASAGYEMGLNVGDEIPVKLSRQEKGLQITKIRSVNNNTNEPRIANEFLTFVPARVKMFNGDFGFVSIDHHFKTGEPLDKTVDAYFNHHLLTRAQYTSDDGTSVQKDDILMVKYYTYKNGKSTVTQIMYKDKAEETLQELYSQADASQAA